jgi:hypothetical protein
MTYLALINKVLIRLRELVATTPTDNDYVTLIGYLVNDAKKTVEEAWDWTALKTTFTVSAVIADNTYTLTGFGTNFKLLDVYNATQLSRMELISQNEMNDKINLNTAATGAPSYFSYNGSDASGDQKIIVYPTPDASYTLKFDAVVREAELTLAADTTKLPTQPIIMIAWAMATRERGETGGTAAQELFGLADRYLGDAIALDATRYQADLTWRVV